MKFDKNMLYYKLQDYAFETATSAYTKLESDIIGVYHG